jgi:molecular chaperone GrpE
MENQSTNEANQETLESKDSTGSAEVKEEKAKVEEINYKDKFFYLAAEMENMKRRYDREKENLIKFGNEKILTELLDVQDNFERTVMALKVDTDEKIKNVVFGIDMISKQFIESLKKFGLTEVKALGEIFDPNVHEALAQEQAEGKKEMEIIRVYQNGYLLNGRLIRPAKVVVAKNN